MFATNAQLEAVEDSVLACLCKLQDGLKVSTNEADDALQQYRKFQCEMGRLQSQIERPSVQNMSTYSMTNEHRTPKRTSSLYVQEKSFKERTEKIIESKEKEIVALRHQNAELTARLSALVGTQRVSVDDNKSDLTDVFKPMKLAEDYRAIFDNEWQAAFNELRVLHDEAKILIYLGKVTWSAYEFSKDICDQQLADLMQHEIDILKTMSKPRYTEKERRKPIVANGLAPRKFERDETLQLLRNFRQVLARTSVVGIKKIFLTIMSRTPPSNGGTLTDCLKKYILKVAEITYLMCIQNPSMHLEWSRFGDDLDHEKFKPYSGNGDKIVGTIWPVVLLHRDGPVMSRGIADVMYKHVPESRPLAVKKYRHC